MRIEDQNSDWIMSCLQAWKLKACVYKKMLFQAETPKDFFETELFYDKYKHGKKKKTR